MAITASAITATTTKSIVVTDQRWSFIRGSPIDWPLVDVVVVDGVTLVLLVDFIIWSLCYGGSWKQQVVGRTTSSAFVLNNGRMSLSPSPSLPFAWRNLLLYCRCRRGHHRPCKSRHSDPYGCGATPYDGSSPRRGKPIDPMLQFPPRALGLWDSLVGQQECWRRKGGDTRAKSVLFPYPL